MHLDNGHFLVRKHDSLVNKNAQQNLTPWAFGVFCGGANPPPLLGVLYHAAVAARGLRFIPVRSHPAPPPSLDWQLPGTEPLPACRHPLTLWVAIPCIAFYTAGLEVGVLEPWWTAFEDTVKYVVWWPGGGKPRPQPPAHVPLGPGSELQE